MDFSYTEIQIRARYLVTGEEVKVATDFLKNLTTLDMNYHKACHDDVSERICPAEFKVGSWKKPGGLVAMRKSREEILKEFSCERIEIVTVEKQPANALPSLSNIAAIDFGTTYCSLAIITEGEKFPICIKLDGYRLRVSNAILLKRESSNTTSVCCSIKEFGPRAQDEHTKLKADTVNQHLFFERIKMNLQHDPVSVETA